jgi:hypothetical protein
VLWPPRSDIHMQLHAVVPAMLLLLLLERMLPWQIGAASCKGVWRADSPPPTRHALMLQHPLLLPTLTL